jgi:chemotaxis protein methyltransferase CheR
VKGKSIVELQPLNEHQFERFRDFIYEKSGIRIGNQKVSLLTNRIRRRVKAGEFKDFDAYYHFLTSAAGVAELEGFLDAVTTNETFFFRTEGHFDWLRQELLTQLISDQRAGLRSQSLRIWSAGCANGAEPYTIAICLAENRYRLRDWSITILGTDISEEALRAAREGVFKPRAIESVSDRQRQRYFKHHKSDNLWQIRPEIRELVRFKRHNLLQPLSEPEFDCIFIRNVLIYFDRDSKQIAISNMLRSLASGGHLAVGPSEGVYGMLTPLQRISPLVYQKVDGSPQHTSGSVTGDPRK